MFGFLWLLSCTPILMFRGANYTLVVELAQINCQTLSFKTQKCYVVHAAEEKSLLLVFVIQFI